MKSKAYASEFVGTFCMIFAGCGAMTINDISGGAITHVGVALTWGLIVMAMIYSLGDVSGAHMNSAVTIAFAAAGRFSWTKVPGYIAAQFAGAIAAAGVLRLLFVDHPTLGASLPATIDGHHYVRETFVLEIILTWILMFVVLRVSTGAKEKGITAAIAIGGVVGLEAMFAGPICKASMNPARSLGPALVSGNLEHLWIYFVATILGALLAVPTAMLLAADGVSDGEASGKNDPQL